MKMNFLKIFGIPIPGQFSEKSDFRQVGFNRPIDNAEKFCNANDQRAAL